MKKKILLISAIIFIIALIPFAVLAVKNSISYTDAGRPIVHTGEEIPEEIQGEEFSLAVPVNQTSATEEMLQKEKDNSLNKICIDNISNLSITANNEISKEIDISMNKAEILEAENNFIVVLKKYYGDNETETLFNSIKNETDINSKNSTQYTFPENGKTLLRAIIDIIDNSNPTEEEVEILKKVVQSMDLTTLNDEKLTQRINNL